MEKYLGISVLSDLYKCNSELITDIKSIEKILLDAVQIGKWEITECCFQEYDHGLCGVIIGKDSYIAIYTYPEYNYASLILYSNTEDWKPIYTYIVGQLESPQQTFRTVNQGILSVINGKGIRTQLES